MLITCLIILALLFFTAAFITLVTTQRHPEKAGIITRHKVVGGILMIIMFLWLVLAGADMLCLDVSSSLVVGLFCLSPILALVLTNYLDFIVTRALSGLLILLATTIIDQAFFQNIPYRFLPVIVCHIAAICALYLLWVPYRLRDFWQKTATSPMLRRLTSAFMILCGISLIASVFLMTFPIA